MILNFFGRDDCPPVQVIRRWPSYVLALVLHEGLPWPSKTNWFPDFFVSWPIACGCRVDYDCDQREWFIYYPDSSASYALWSGRPLLCDPSGRTNFCMDHSPKECFQKILEYAESEAT